VTAIDWDEQLMRTLLFVPGSDERKLAKNWPRSRPSAPT
jgi:hypothetical protein